MIFTIILWIVGVLALVPAVAIVYYLIRGHGGGKLLDLLIGAAISGLIGWLVLAKAIQRTFHP